MYAFIFKKNEVVILNEKVMDLNTGNVKITDGTTEIEISEINVIKEFVETEMWNRHTVTLKSNLDITKKYKAVVAGTELELDIKQYYKTEEFKNLYSYTGYDLGCTLTENETVFKVWTPTATKVVLKVYENDTTTTFESFELQQGEHGIFYYKHTSSLEGKYYNFDVTCFGETREAVDIYAKAVGTNGLRAVVVNLKNTDPENFRVNDFANPASITDAIIYEVHVRDLSMDENSNIKNKGKFLGFTERGTKNSFGQTTGIDHIVELGATHVHLLPSFDYKSIDESKLEENDFNWGYDPQNYNVPEGSYSTDPSNGETRIREMKLAIQAMHKAGLGVIMDVVYNHTYDTAISNHEKFVPGYYYRADELGNMTDGSACSNETASERFMVRKHFIDSVVYWATEYKIDGFRFDLMGLHDVETMNQIRTALDKVNPNIIIYGEGWCGGPSPLKDEEKAVKANAPKTNVRIAYFSDDVRDGIKGDVFVDETPGFVNGGLKSLEDVKFGVVGSVKHSGVNIEDVKYSDEFWANEPTQTITYCSAHDNLTLFDKFIKTSPSASDEELVQMNKMAAFITHISQGAVFYQAGEEMARTKGGDENSYKSPDSVNKIDWDRKNQYLGLFEYYKGLGKLRKSDGVFRLTDAKEVNKRISFGKCNDQFLVVNYKAKNNEYCEYVALVNAQDVEETYNFEDSAEYVVLVDGNSAGTTPLRTLSANVTVPPRTAMLLAKGPSAENKISKLINNKKTIGLVALAAVAVGAVVVGGIRRKIKR